MIGIFWVIEAPFVVQRFLFVWLVLHIENLNCAKFSSADISEVGGKEQLEAQPARKGRGRKQ